MGVSLVFIDVSICSVTREEGGRGAESIAVLGHREHLDQVLHRANGMDGDVAVVGCVIDKAHVGTDVTRALTGRASAVV